MEKPKKASQRVSKRYDLYLSEKVSIIFVEQSNKKTALTFKCCHRCKLLLANAKK